MLAGPRYAKPWRSLAEQVQLLVDRGMIVASPEEAERWLSLVGYYRLSGYWYPYRAGRPNGPRSSSFHPGVTFDQVVALYTFDRHLKLLVQDAVERIEIAMRVKVGHTLGRRGPFAHQDPTELNQRFASSPRYTDWQGRLSREVSRSREDFVHHFNTSYDGALPIWVATEVMDFGCLSVLYGGLKGVDRNSIAEEFGVVDGRGVPNGAALAAWFRQLNTVRNIVAHHSRLWNRNIGPRPTLGPLRAIPVLTGLNNHELDRLFGPLSIVAYLLQQVSPSNDWTARVGRLILAELPATGRREAEMGFSTGWQQQPLWAP